MFRSIPPDTVLKALTRGEAAKWAGRTVGLYGGSFNPGHEGHLHVGIEALKRLPLDAVWYMVSPGNPLKDDTDMAPFEARLESARELADYHPRLHVTDIEARIGSRYTAETLELLVGLFPRTQFIWMMGADNMKQFNQWFRWDEIVSLLPIAIFDRPGYTVSGFASKFAKRFKAAEVKPFAINTTAPAWTFVRMPRHPASATEIRQRLGHRWITHLSGSVVDATLLADGD